MTNLQSSKQARTVIAFAADPLAHVEKKGPVIFAIDFAFFIISIIDSC